MSAAIRRFGATVRRSPPTKFRLLRLALGATLEDFADAVGCSAPVIAKIERGRRRLDPDEAARIAKVFRVRRERMREIIEDNHARTTLGA